MSGVVFPITDIANGKRGTTETGIRILRAALDAAETDAAASASASLGAEKAWRSGYVKHFQAVAQAMAGHETTLVMARAGLKEAAEAFEFIGGAAGVSVPVAALVDPDAPAAASPALCTAIIVGNDAERALAPTIMDVPFSGRLHSGAELLHLVRSWVDKGQAHATFASSVAEAVGHPEWFDLRGKVFVLIGVRLGIGLFISLTAHDRIPH